MSDTAHDPHALTDLSSDCDDLDSALTGGWSPAVWNFIRWLRANSCSDYADGLERHARSVPPDDAPHQARQAALIVVRDELAFLKNNRPEALTPQQRKEWGDQLRTAIKSVMDELRRLAEAGARARRAAKAIAPLLERLPPVAPALTGGGPQGVGPAHLPPVATHRPPAPPAVAEPPGPPPRSRAPNETTEQPVIDALHRLGAIGVEGLRAIDKKKRPTGERLAPIAIGRGCDGQFKATLAHMVDLGWLGNGREHGLGGGYFLTPAGVALVTKRK